LSRGLSSACCTDSPDSLLNAQFFALEDAAAHAAYLELWEISPQRSGVAHPLFIEAIGSAFGHPVKLVAITDEKGWQVAAPVFEKRRGPFKAAALPPVTPVLSPLLRGPIHESEINQRRSSLDVLLRRLADTYDQVTLQLHPSITDTRPFAWAGWTVTPRYTHVADLTVDDPVEGWSKSARYTIRAEAERFRVEEDQQHAEVGIALMEASYERKEKELGLSRSTLTTLVRRLAQDGLARVFAATRDDDDSPEAVAIIAHDGQSAHYWIAGSKPGPAMGVLQAEAGWYHFARFYWRKRTLGSRVQAEVWHETPLIFPCAPRLASLTSRAGPDTITPVTHQCHPLPNPSCRTTPPELIPKTSRTGSLHVRRCSWSC